MKQILFANVERYEREILRRIDLEPIVEAMLDMRSLRSAPTVVGNSGGAQGAGVGAGFGVAA